MGRIFRLVPTLAIGRPQTQHWLVHLVQLGDQVLGDCLGNVQASPLNLYRVRLAVHDRTPLGMCLALLGGHKLFQAVGSPQGQAALAVAAVEGLVGVEGQPVARPQGGSGPRIPNAAPHRRRRS